MSKNLNSLKYLLLQVFSGVKKKMRPWKILNIKSGLIQLKLIFPFVEKGRGGEKKRTF